MGEVDTAEKAPEQNGGPLASAASGGSDVAGLEKAFVRLLDWAMIWHRQAGGYLASDTGMMLFDCIERANKIIDRTPELEWARPKNQFG